MQKLIAMFQTIIEALTAAVTKQKDLQAQVSSLTKTNADLQAQHAEDLKKFLTAPQLDAFKAQVEAAQTAQAEAEAKSAADEKALADEHAQIDALVSDAKGHLDSLPVETPPAPAPVVDPVVAPTPDPVPAPSEPEVVASA